MAGLAGITRAYPKEYEAYLGAKYRCTNPRHKNYKNYGGRGIKFLFTDFRHFLDTVGPSPSPELSVDRIDNNGNYEPTNCRWATIFEQNNNQRRARGEGSMGLRDQSMISAALLVAYAKISVGPRI